MKILLLVNNAPGFPPFFLNLGAALSKDGHQVFYALNSKLIYYECPEYKDIEKTFLFSEFFANTDLDAALLENYPDINPWEMLFPDFDRYESHRINLDKRLPWYRRLASSLLAFFQKIIEENQIDVVMYETISNSYSYFSYVVAKKLGATYIGLSSSRLPGRFELHESTSGIRNQLERRYNQIASGQESIPDDVESEVARYIADFEKIEPDYTKINRLLFVNPFKKYINASKIQLVLKRLAYVLHEKKSTFPYEASNPLLYSYHQFRHNLLRYVRTPFIKKCYSEISDDDDYFLYPLQFHPEASTSVHARFFVDEYTVIKNIAMSLPFDCWLYVKDQNIATGYHRLHMYKDISAIPNVKLLSSDENTKSVIRQSRAVITLTSTVGFEAIVLGKPVYVIGDVFYDFHPLCRKIRDWPELASALSSAPSTFRSDETTFEFLAAYWSCTHPGLFRYVDVPETDPLILAIAEAVELHFPFSEERCS